MKIKSIIKKYFKLYCINVFLSIFTIILAMGLTVFYVSGPGKEAVLAKAPKFVVKTAVKLRNDISDLKYIFKKFPSADLPSYQLFIDKENLAKLDESIPDLDKRAQDPNYLPSINDLLLEENKVYVPGKFVADGREYDVEVRYRGGGFPHWSEAKKSLRLIPSCVRNESMAIFSLVSRYIPHSIVSFLLPKYRMISRW